MEKEREKSRRKHRDSDHYDREKVTEPAKDSKDRDQHRHHRSSREKSRDFDDNEVQEQVRESVKDSRDRDQHRHQRSSREESRDVDDDGVQESDSVPFDREKVRELVKDSKNRDQHRQHRSSREKSREVDEDVHRHRSDRRPAREYSVEREKSVDYLRNEREGSRDRHKVEKSYDREESVERRNSKRKDRGLSEEDVYIYGGAKRVRAVEEKKGRKRFEEDANENGRGEEKKEKCIFEDSAQDKDNRVERKEKRRLEDSVEDKDNREERKEKRKFEDRVKEEEGVVVEKERTEARNFKKEPKQEPIYDNHGDLNRGGSKDHVGALELPATASRTSVDVPLSDNRSPPTKVSSISNKNENKGVNISRSHEVLGKSSTDGTGSDAGKIGGLSADALSKAKRALQMQKELAEKLKKIPLLKKDAGQLLTGKENKAPSTSSGLLPVPAAFENSSTATEGNPASGLPHLVGLTTQKYEAVKRAQELAAKMGFQQDAEFAPLINMFPRQLPPDVSVQPKPPKAPVLRLDALGREIDEYGNVINIPKVNNLSTLKVNINKQNKDAFQILKPELEVDPDKNPHFDPRMGIDKDKLLRPKRMSFQFVEEGKWSKDAEIIKLKSQFGEARTKELKAKQAQLAKAKSKPDINPNLIEVLERVVSKKEKPKEPIPEIEWWDVPFVLAGNYSGVIDGTISEDEIKQEKITSHAQHPCPIEPPTEPVPPPPQPLKLTKKEQKKLRTQRRLNREKEKQDMIRKGLIEPLKPKVKMSNLMRVLGAEATQDPTKLEMEIRSAAADREQAHIDRNIARKLTPAERREKKERKLFDDPSNPETVVSVYKINNLSHPQARFKVDANAYENRLTGCAVISEGVSVVVVEGCPKSIKRYGKLMLRRIDWAASVKKEEVEDEDDDNAHDAPVNKCLLVWQGNVAKPSFNRFSVQECRTEAAARKIFSDAGVAHYWELAVNFTEDQM